MVHTSVRRFQKKTALLSESGASAHEVEPPPSQRLTRLYVAIRYRFSQLSDVEAFEFSQNCLNKQLWVTDRKILGKLEHLYHNAEAFLSGGKTTITLGSFMDTPSFRFIDLFAGIGGMRKGFDAIGGHCVFTSEWNKFSQQTYRANFSHDHSSIAGDITKIHASDIPEHDLLLAGFPCQPFSIAGVSKKNAIGQPHGFRCEAQGTLFFDVARIIEHHRPYAFVLENVKNLVNHDRGNTFRVIRNTLKEELGYHISWRVIDAKGFVPQHRERIFIVGFRNQSDFSLDHMNVPDPMEGPKLETILHPEDGSEGQDQPYTDHKGQVHKRYVLSDHLWQYLQDYAIKHRRRGNGFGFDIVGPEDVARTLSARYYKDGSEILVRRGSSENPRRLTPRECSRLMGFDEPDRSEFVIPVSDTQAYRQFGNAVVVPAVKALALYIAPYLSKIERPLEPVQPMLV